MDKLFNPQSVAIVGASKHPEKLGYQVLKNLIDGGYSGEIFPINLDADDILGHHVYKNITEISDPIDLAILMVPAANTPQVLKEVVEKKVPYAVIISAGFAETGAEGKKLQDELQEIIKETETKVLGPNCLGIFNAHRNLNLTFAASELISGGVSVVLSSGAIGAAMIDWAKEFGFGFAKFVSLGNKVDLEESEIISYLADDKDTKIIALYLEEISSVSKFFHAAKKAALKKPVVILKGGTTQAGAKAAFSHTAAMLTSNKINEAIFTQANLIRAKTIEEMLNLVPILSSEPPVKGKNLAIITNAGGPAVLATDVASRLGFKLPQDKQNPMDLTGTASAESYQTALNYFLADSNYDSILVILTPQSMTEVEKTAQVLASCANARKPVIASFLGSKKVEKGIAICRKNHVPVFDEPEAAVKALLSITKYWEKRENHQEPTELATEDKKGVLSENPLDLISAYGIPTAPGKMVDSIDEALKIVKEIGYPVAVKNLDSGAHKYKTGKLVLNVFNDGLLEKAIEKVGTPALLQKMIEAPFEIICGAKREKDIGIVLSFGWGGIMTEDLSDISAKILPLTENDLDEMIKETRIGRVLIREEVDLEKIKEVLRNLSQLMVDFPEFTEIDLNPLKVTKNEIICVDARIK